jgi:hypothetical protein
LTDYDEIGLRKDDPQGARFDRYAKEPPAEPWACILDDDGIKYRRGLVAQRLRPGWWPFAYADPDREHAARRPLRGENVAQECGVASVRLSPDTTYYAWRNEYVLAGPDSKVPHRARARLELWVRPQGMGGVVVTCEANFDLKTQTCVLSRVGDDWPDRLKAQAEAKASKLTAFFSAAMAGRDAIDGPEFPLTSRDRWDAAKRVRAEMIRAYCEANDLTFKADSIPDRFTVGGKWMTDAEIAARYLPGLFTDSWAEATRRQATHSGRQSVFTQGALTGVPDRSESCAHGLPGGADFPHALPASAAVTSSRRAQRSATRDVQARPGRRS